MTQQHLAELRYFFVLSLIALAIMALASLLIGWFVAGRVLRPLRVMRATARSVSRSKLRIARSNSSTMPAGVYFEPDPGRHLTTPFAFLIDGARPPIRAPLRPTLRYS